MKDRFCVWLGVFTAAAWLAGCAGSVQLSNTYEGVCEQRHERCLTDVCGGLKNTHDCELKCDFEARLCQGDQDGPIDPNRVLGDDRALLVDLGGTTLRHSSTVRAKLVGPTTAVKGAHQFEPGAGLKMSFDLPAQVRSAELHLLHAPAGTGSNCFITLTIGKKTLVGRYAPPRGEPGALRRETWDLSRFVDITAGPTTLEMFLFNNNVAGSKDPYILGGVELYYRAIEPRPDETR